MNQKWVVIFANFPTIYHRNDVKRELPITIHIKLNINSDQFSYQFLALTNRSNHLTICISLLLLLMFALCYRPWLRQFRLRAFFYTTTILFILFYQFYTQRWDRYIFNWFQFDLGVCMCNCLCTWCVCSFDMLNGRLLAGWLVGGPASQQIAISTACTRTQIACALNFILCFISVLASASIYCTFVYTAARAQVNACDE